ncbi:MULTISPECIES: N(4)-(beta-N-acetylglucosaminyl)-L-asparaginase [Vagococcus]|uniref:Isoaspartyl aminopeptidase @ Asp-X dipeptidase n=1 Tax=Vagococcus fluvialis bH819 TaxID=1255619 RepID=A0A1X8XKW4_9ENTE|nr:MULTISPECIES: N(4)-(beta-N-acetylglucosaminyl)-L-asparaginase [Vagococcus]SLM84508.1 Isoaspartyl aminopeptidase @ Asp-X dipeptidase [Vagococcus fluvialis bH819]HCM90546.1 N(4)-(beta-N-acetylglucosaminyl)-L-asparaginase [Vagococcus sp.]
MTYGTIATWRMAHDGIVKAMDLLKKNGSSGDALEVIIQSVENYPYYKSVGFGGLPNAKGILEMDAAFMNGDTFQLGAIAGIVDIKNPISVARKLSSQKFNSFLVGQGATDYAIEEGFEQKKMLTDRAKKIWSNRLENMKKHNLSPYDGHDTVGVVTLDQEGSMTVGTSSSGLFMKRPGRVGDSPLSGSGFYVDSSIGGASATGLGEDLMKGCLAYEIVRKMKEGLSPQEACDQTVYPFHDLLTERQGKAGAFSLIAMDNQGRWGVATNVEFTFSVGNQDDSPAIFIANMGENHSTTIEPISNEWLAAYEKRIKAPIN